MTDEEIVRAELEESRKYRDRILFIAKNVQDRMGIGERYNVAIGARIADGLAQAALEAFEKNGVSWIQEARLREAQFMVATRESQLAEEREALRALKSLGEQRAERTEPRAMTRVTADDMRRTHYDCYPHSSFQAMADAVNRQNDEFTREAAGLPAWPSHEETTRKIMWHALERALLGVPEEYE